MPSPTYDLLDSTTLASSASSVTFSSISQDYRDLVLVFEIKGATTNAYSGIRFNGDSGSNYGYVNMRGNGSSALSSSGTLNNGTAGAVFSEASTTESATAVVQIMDYSATDKHKTFLTRDKSVGITSASAVRWANTSAITSVQVLDTGGANYAVGSTFYLYGIAS